MNKVSVIIPTYKRANMLQRAINSVLNQTYKNIEVIVVDDNDPNSKYRSQTMLIMEYYNNDNRVKYIKHSKNLNGSAARNTGASNSTGNVITYLDDDDWYDRKKIESQLNYLLKNPKYKAVYCGIYRDDKFEIPSDVGDLSFQILKGDIVIRTNTIMIWKETLMEIGGWKEEFIRNQEAALLLSYFSKGYEIGLVKKPLVYYDLSDRSNALSPKLNKKQYDFFIQKHMYIIKEIEKVERNAKKTIITRRYRSILFAYLKERKILGALKHYVMTTLKYPFVFNFEIFTYLSYKIRG